LRQICALPAFLARHGVEHIVRFLEINYPVKKDVFLRRLHTELRGIIDEIESSKIQER
jgi:hypothetical protein